MNIDLGNIFSGIGSTAKDITSIITGKLPPKEEAELQAKILQIEASTMQAQAQINQQEAQHKSLFVAGWRPALGWLCIIILGLHFLILPIARWATEIIGLEVVFFEFDLGHIWSVIIGMLGIGTLRSFDKRNGKKK
jgi:hypothetical protein